MRWNRLALVALALCLFTGMAAAADFSFTGVFTQDDQLQIFLFTAPSSNVILRTWGYAGGVNAAGDTIFAGGFDPVLTLFDATGGLISSSPWIADNNDGAGVASDLVNAFDSLLQLTGLDPTHTYALILSQWDNAAPGTGSTYIDGFSRAGQGNFTAQAFGCGGDSFCDNAANQRNGNWAVDIIGVGGVAGVPEPGSMLLLVTGIGTLALLRRRAKQA